MILYIQIYIVQYTHIYLFFSLQKELGAAVKLHPTATEQLVELFKAQQLNDSEKKDDSEAVQEDSEHVQRA